MDIGSFSVLYNVTSDVADTMVPAVFVGSYHPVLTGCESHIAVWLAEAGAIALSEFWWAYYFTWIC